MADRPSPSKELRLSVRSSPDFRAWTLRLADFTRLGTNSLVETALVSHAKAVGFTEPPPRRKRLG